MLEVLKINSNSFPWKDCSIINDKGCSQKLIFIEANSEHGLIKKNAYTYYKHVLKIRPLNLKSM